MGNKIAGIIAGLMDIKRQQTRPPNQRGRYQVERGLWLMVKSLGPVEVLTMWRVGKSPSANEALIILEALRTLETVPGQIFRNRIPRQVGNDGYFYFIWFKTDGFAPVEWVNQDKLI